MVTLVPSTLCCFDPSDQSALSHQPDRASGESCCFCCWSRHSEKYASCHECKHFHTAALSKLLFCKCIWRDKRRCCVRTPPLFLCFSYQQICTATERPMKPAVLIMLHAHSPLLLWLTCWTTDISQLLLFKQCLWLFQKKKKSLNIVNQCLV